MSAVGHILRDRPSAELTGVRGRVRPRAFEARVHAGLSAAQAVWKRLEMQGKCTAFQHYDWVTMVVRHLAEPGDEVLVVEILDADIRQPVMALPLVRRRHLGWRVIEWLNFGVCDYAAPLLASGVVWSDADAAAAWTAARKALPTADLLRIDGLPREVFGVANPLVMLPRACLSAHTTCGFPIGGDAESVLERCCSLSFVRRYWRSRPRLERRGAVQFVEARTEAEVETIFSVMLEQRLTRFRRLGRYDLLSRPAVVAFYREAALQGLKGGPVRLHGLRVGEEWVGASYSVVDGGAYQGLIITIADEPPWRHSSLGIHVHAQAIKWAAAMGLTYFDMSVGASAYKDESGGRREPLFAIDEALTLRGRVILLGLRAYAAAEARMEKSPWIATRLRRARRQFRRIRACLGAARRSLS